MLTGERLQYLADLLPENVSWGDPLNAVMLDQILAAHSAGAQGMTPERRFHFANRMIHIDDLGDRIALVRAIERELLAAHSAGEQGEPVGYVSKGWADTRIGLTTIYPDSRPRLATQPVYVHPQPLTQTDAARDALTKRLEANFHNELKSFLSKRDQGKVMGIFRRAMAETAEIERIDRAKGE